MSRKSWYSQRQGQIRLGDTEVGDGPARKVAPVPKAALEEGILQLLASAAEMQQRQDLDSALQLYQAAMEKVRDHGLNRKRLFTGTNKKPPPLNSRYKILSTSRSKRRADSRGLEHHLNGAYTLETLRPLSAY